MKNMTDLKKLQKLKLLAGGKNSANQPLRRRNSDRRNLLTHEFGCRTVPVTVRRLEIEPPPKRILHY
jgi:hypothetical protein